MAHVSVTPFSQQLIDLINAHVNKELTAYYAYFALSVHFGRHDIALENTANYFKHSSAEERDHADKFIGYIQERGGSVELKDIKAITIPSGYTLLEALEKALEMEKEVFKSIVGIHTAAAQVNDAHLTSFLESDFFEEQTKEEDKYMRLIAIAKRMGSGLGEQLFDKDIITKYM